MIKHQSALGPSLQLESFRNFRLAVSKLFEQNKKRRAQKEQASWRPAMTAQLLSNGASYLIRSTESGRVPGGALVLARIWGQLGGCAGWLAGWLGLLAHFRAPLPHLSRSLSHTPLLVERNTRALICLKTLRA